MAAGALASVSILITRQGHLPIRAFLNLVADLTRPVIIYEEVLVHIKSQGETCEDTGS